MLIHVAGAPSRAPAAISDEELTKAYQVNYRMSLEKATNLMRGYRALSENPNVKCSFSVPDGEGDIKWCFVLQEDTVERIVTHWAKTVPVVAQRFAQQLKDQKTMLVDPAGFTSARLAKLLLDLPTSLYYMLKALDDHFFDDKVAIRKFIQAFPDFQMKQ